MKVLVTGISGLGGHFAPHLVAAGHDVIGMSRAASRVAVDIPVVEADATRMGDLDRALEGVEVAYFMIHSYEQANADGFVDRDRRIAGNFATAAARAGVRRVIYLGVPPIARAALTSAHVASRLEVEDILIGSTPDSVTLGAFTIVSARSRSFRVLLNLLATNRFIPLPPWRRHVTQPMDLRDVFACLVAAATQPGIGGRRLRIGGPCRMSWDALLRGLAAHMNARRVWLPTPFDVPPSVSRALIRLNGGNPALMLPLLETIASGDITVADNDAGALGVSLHPIQDTLANAVVEYHAGTWRTTEGRPIEPVHTITT